MPRMSKTKIIIISENQFVFGEFSLMLFLQFATRKGAQIFGHQTNGSIAKTTHIPSVFERTTEKWFKMRTGNSIQWPYLGAN